MNSENKNNGMPSPEDFWPEAKDLLDHHFEKKRKTVLFFGMSLVLIISAIGLFFNYTSSSLNSRISSNKTNLHTQLETTKSSNAKSLNKNSHKAVVTSAQHNNSKQLSVESVQKNNNIEHFDAKSYAINATQIITSASTHKTNIFKSTLNEKIETTNTENIEEIAQDNLLMASVNRDFTEFSKLPLMSYKIPESLHYPGLNENKIAIENVYDDYFKNKNKINYYVGAYAGLQNVSKRIRSDETLTEYAAIRSTAEKKINTAYYGINFTIEKKDILLQTGLEYHTIGEQNAYEAKSKQWLKNDEKVWDVYNRQIIKVDTVYHFGIVNYHQTIINVKDSTLLNKSDSIFVYHTDSNIVKANGNTAMNYLEIPFMIAYQFRFGKATLAPFAGVSVAYLTSTSGAYINRSITGTEEIQLNNLIKTFNFNYQFKLQFSYDINENLMLTLTPNYRNNILSVNSKNTGINTKYSTFGTSFGIIYKLK